MQKWCHDLQTLQKQSGILCFCILVADVMMVAMMSIRVSEGFEERGGRLDVGEAAEICGTVCHCGVI